MRCQFEDGGVFAECAWLQNNQSLAKGALSLATAVMQHFTF